jgi:heptosyltransferase-2
MRILIIQTAFIGDAILATALIEEIARQHPEAFIDFLVRKGNEIILKNNPHINEIFVWIKDKNKYRNLWNLVINIRKKQYDIIVNPHRFGSSGFICLLSGAKKIYGFSKNPFSWIYTKKTIHQIGNGTHEIERNFGLIDTFCVRPFKSKPKVYFSKIEQEKIKHLKVVDYVCMAPTSVWYTKQLPKEQWIKLINNKYTNTKVYLLGAQSDFEFCEDIAKNSHENVENLCGKLNLLESALLMQHAKMNYVNDSAPMHLCSAVNAPVTVFFCSTVPDFGFGPLSGQAKIIQIGEKLACRPCGLHGYKTCPKQHFDCGEKINVLI